VTRRQWDTGEDPETDGFRPLVVAPGGRLYDARGRRRLLPPVLFGLGVFAHFARNRRRYDVVDCASYPFLALIAVRLALAGRRGVRVRVQWLELLSKQYWRAYAGPVGGLLGRLLQRLCVRLTPTAFAISGLVESRLRAAGFRGEIHRLPGLWVGDPAERRPAAELPSEPLAVFAGRHVPDKGVAMLPDAIHEARRTEPKIRAAIVGDGPERPRVLRRIEELGLEDAIEAPGFIDREPLEDLMRRASCMVLPSMREGYGLAVIEAASHGVPAVVCRAPDNAATALIAEGVNGVIASSPSPQVIAPAILDVVGQGAPLRRSTADWFAQNAQRLSIRGSIELIREVTRPGVREAMDERARFG